VEIIEEAIKRGEFSEGDQLPTEDILCTQQSVSKAVIRTAMQELSRKGYVKKIPGKGTFIRKTVEKKGVWLSTTLTEKFLDFGIDWETEVVQKMLSVPPTDLAELFSIESGHQVFKVMRIRSIDDIPLVLETAYVSHDLCPGLPVEDLRSCSLPDLIVGKYGIPIIRCADSLEITTLESRETALLKKKEGCNALLADRILYTTNNRVVAFIRAISVSDKHRITFEAVRA
jgi:GntR family transcriptional regulator